MNWNVKLNDFFEGSSTDWDDWALYVKTNLEKKWPGNIVTMSRASDVHQFPIENAGGIEKEVDEFIGSLWISWWANKQLILKNCFIFKWRNHAIIKSSTSRYHKT